MISRGYEQHGAWYKTKREIKVPKQIIFYLKGSKSNYIYFQILNWARNEKNYDKRGNGVVVRVVSKWIIKTNRKKSKNRSIMIRTKIVRIARHKLPSMCWKLFDLSLKSITTCINLTCMQPKNQYQSMEDDTIFCHCCVFMHAYAYFEYVYTPSFRVHVDESWLRNLIKLTHPHDD